MLLFKNRKTFAHDRHKSMNAESDPNTISYDIDKANERAKRMLHENNSRKDLKDRARL